MSNRNPFFSSKLLTGIQTHPTEHQLFIISDLIKCPTLPIPTNGFKISLPNGSKNVVFFACDKQTTLVGSQMRVCLPNATWTGSQTYCKNLIPFLTAFNYLTTLVFHEPLPLDINCLTSSRARTIIWR